MPGNSLQDKRGWRGLGVKNLATHNACLLLKLIHRLHHHPETELFMGAADLPCLTLLEIYTRITGVPSDSDMSSAGTSKNHESERWGTGASTSFWYDLGRNITRVTVGDGSTSFGALFCLNKFRQQKLLPSSCATGTVEAQELRCLP
jgi:hypothetical protein